MEENGEESVQQSKVRNLVHAYEKQTNYTESVEEFGLRPRAKSIGNALTYKLFRDPNLEFNTLLDIEKEIVKIDAHLNYYEIYEKETHVAFQEQIFEVLKALVSVDPEGCETTIQKKKELIRQTQKLSKILNSKLPYDNSRSGYKFRKGLAFKREENTVSTTGRFENHKTSSFSSQASVSSLNKSLESLHSLKDTTDYARSDELPDHLQNHGEIPQPDTTIQSLPENEVEAPKPKSVSRLARFFSFRTETKPEIKVGSSSYSSISKSASFSSKTNKYQTYKSYKDQKKLTKDEFNETEEELGKEGHEVDSNEHLDSTDTNDNKVQPEWSVNDTYVEPSEETEDQDNEEVRTNISVSKLKSFFEERKEEDREVAGLGLLTNKRTRFNTGFDIPYTEMNLGQFRLKRALSGNYLNFGAGILKKVDIEKKAEMNKSKSTSDLLDRQRRYKFDDEELDDDVTKEIDDEDEEVHRVVLGSERLDDVNNNEDEEEIPKKEDIDLQHHNVSVNALKQTFERINSQVAEYNEVNKIIHRTTRGHHHKSESVQITNFGGEELSLSRKSSLEDPIQFRIATQSLEDSHSETPFEYQTNEEYLVKSRHQSTDDDHEEHNVNKNHDEFITEIQDEIESSSKEHKEDVPSLEVPVQLRISNFEAQDKLGQETLEEENTKAQEIEKYDTKNKISDKAIPNPQLCVNEQADLRLDENNSVNDFIHEDISSDQNDEESSELFEENKNSLLTSTQDVISTNNIKISNFKDTQLKEHKEQQNVIIDYEQIDDPIADHKTTEDSDSLLEVPVELIVRDNIPAEQNVEHEKDIDVIQITPEEKVLQVENTPANNYDLTQREGNIDGVENVENSTNEDEETCTNQTSDEILNVSDELDTTSEHEPESKYKESTNTKDDNSEDIRTSVTAEISNFSSENTQELTVVNKTEDSKLTEAENINNNVILNEVDLKETPTKFEVSTNDTKIEKECTNDTEHEVVGSSLPTPKITNFSSDNEENKNVVQPDEDSGVAEEAQETVQINEDSNESNLEDLDRVHIEEIEHHNGIDDNFQDSNVIISEASDFEDGDNKSLLEIPPELRVTNFDIDHNAVSVGVVTPNSTELTISNHQSIENINNGYTISNGTHISQSSESMSLLKSVGTLTALKSSTTSSKTVLVGTTQSTFSEKHTIHHSSTTSHRTVTSSSRDATISEVHSSSDDSNLELSRQNGKLTTNNSSATTVVTSQTIQGSKKVTETKNTNLKTAMSLNLSQENIIDEILSDNDNIENLDEEFESLVLEDNK